MGTEVKNIDWALSATDRASPVFRGIESNMERLSASWGRLTAMIGAGGALAGFVAMTKGAIEAEASLHKLALQTGLTVELLSALRPIAKQSGTDFDDVAGMVNKLEKNMLTFAQSGGGKAADAFKQLGYSQADVQVGLRNMDAFLPAFAKRLTETGVGGEQAGLAMLLMAKGGAAALPFLKQLMEAGALNAKVTADQAEAAHQFEVNMVKLQGASNELWKNIANSLIPSLNNITTAMLDARKAGEGFWGSMKEGAKSAMQAMMGWTAAGQLPKLNQQIAEMTDKWMSLENMQGTRGITAERVAGVRSELEALITRRNALELSVKMDAPAKKDDVRTPLPPTEPSGGKVDKSLQDARALMKRQVDQFNHDYWEGIQERNDVEAQLIAEGQIEAAAEYRKGTELMKQQVFDEIDAVYARDIEMGKAYQDAVAAGSKETKKATGFMQELGFTMVSELENAILHWNGLRSAAQGFFNDLAKIALRKGVLDPLGSAAGDWLKSGIGSLFGAEVSGARASGGPVSGGGAYLVGEQGPELFTPPSGGGMITPNHQLGGAEINFNFTFAGGPPTSPQEFLASVVPVMRGIARNEMAKQLRPGGTLA